MVGKSLHCRYRPPSTNFSPLHVAALLLARVPKCGAKPPGPGWIGTFVVSVGAEVERGLPNFPVPELFASWASCPTLGPCQCVSQHMGSAYDQRAWVWTMLWFDTRRYPKMSSIPGSLHLLNEAICTLTMRSNETMLSQSYCKKDGGIKFSAGGNLLKPKIESTGNWTQAFSLFQSAAADLNLGERARESKNPKVLNSCQNLFFLKD